MSVSPLARADALRIGSVDFVSPDEIKVLLELDAPDVVALNTGSPRPFPRVNGYVLVPSDGGLLVGQVEWITVERSPYPKRKGLQDFGLIDLPYPLRKLSLNPLGVLRSELDRRGATRLRFKRGVDAYPTVGQPVLLPTTVQLTSIVESGDNRRVWIGTSPLAGDARVSIDPDRLFGRHVAVLGNTGSGKSCSVAGLIRWSLEAAKDANAEGGKGKGPNARFIVLDPNGEYAKAFDDMDSFVEVRRFAVEPGVGVKQLQVPLWFWNSEEWCAFTQAAPKVQRPLLKRALRDVRLEPTPAAGTDEAHEMNALRRYLVSRDVMIQNQIKSGAIASEATKFGTLLEAIRADVESRADAVQVDLNPLIKHILQAQSRRFNSFKDKSTGQMVEFYKSFHEGDVRPISGEIVALIEELGGRLPPYGPSEDVPLPFVGTDLADHLEVLGAEQYASQFIEGLATRIRTLLADPRMSRILTASDINLKDWLSTYIGDDGCKKASITVIDLSLVSAEVVHVLTAVIARVTLEAQQRYRKLDGGKVLPTVLVMEEAHTFVKRYKEDAENQNSAAICCQVFEKIAREGRKFGLGLVLSSQRPSELSPTVLSQCNTFLLHRISNDRDQELVHKLVPDNLRGLLRDLSSLPARQALLLGWASELPTLVDMRHLPDGQRPKSDDPDFWDVWTWEKERPTQWADIASDWQDQSGGDSGQFADADEEEG